MTVSILIGDVMARLADIPDESVDVVVTSPPYWGLRSYIDDGDPLKHLEIGLEPTLGEHLQKLVAVFAEVRRVLKKSGVCWLNYGDCYATSPNGRSAADTKAAGGDDRTFRDKPFSTVGAIYAGPSSKSTLKGNGHVGGGPKAKSIMGQAGGRGGGHLKPKDLCMIPARLAIALQEDGWWVRSEIIWGKPNPMPESISDRPATSHEKIFMLTKAPRYFYDHTAVRQNLASSSSARLAQNVEAQAGSERANGGAKTNGTMKAAGGRRGKQAAIAAAAAAAAAAAGGSSGRRMSGFNERWDQKEKMRASDLGPRHVGNVGNVGIDATPRGEGRNLRNYEPAPVQVWAFSTAGFSDAHFATFPPELVERCLLTAPKKCCSVCGEPWGRRTVTTLVPTEAAALRAVINDRNDLADDRDAGSNREKDGHVPGWCNAVETLGFEPACGCEAPSARPTVLDPFGGAGTVGLVADRHGMDCTLIELNPASAEIAARRLRTGLVAVEGVRPDAQGDAGPLFAGAAA